ncbi:hypothetical protein G3I55_12180 [Streptomyces sp. SID6648]|nr:hypothetical protein [Streptomyces sp. SID6648]
MPGPGRQRLHRTLPLTSRRQRPGSPERPRPGEHHCPKTVIRIPGSSLGAPVLATPRLLCDQCASTAIQGGKYVVQNNRWGASTRQCIDVWASGFAITAAVHNNPTNNVPTGYPSIYAGCHYATALPAAGSPFAYRISGTSAVRSP